MDSLLSELDFIPAEKLETDNRAFAFIARSSMAPRRAVTMLRSSSILLTGLRMAKYRTADAAKATTSPKTIDVSFRLMVMMDPPGTI